MFKAMSLETLACTFAWEGEHALRAPGQRAEGAQNRAVSSLSGFGLPFPSRPGGDLHTIGEPYSIVPYFASRFGLNAWRRRPSAGPSETPHFDPAAVIRF